jgi:hypothetical protein
MRTSRRAFGHASASDVTRMKTVLVLVSIRWTFRQNQALLTFRLSAAGGPATELRFDRGGGYFILKRQ